MADDTLFSIIIWLAFIISGFLGWYFYNKSRHEERKLLIEKGKNPYDNLTPKTKDRSIWLKIGIIAISLGIGLLIMTALINLNWDGRSGLIFPAVLSLCGGIGVVIAQYLGNKQKPE